MRRFRLPQISGFQPPTHFLSQSILGLLIGLFDLGMIRPISAIENNSRIADAEVSDPAILVKELARLEAQIKDQAKLVTLGEAISTGIRANPQLLQAFGAIQQYEWQLTAAQRQWFPTVQINNGLPFAGIQWSSFSQTYSSDSLNSPLDSYKSSLSAFQPGILISWNAIDPTRQPNINAASQSLKQQKFLFDVSARSLILSIQQSYYAVQSSQQLIDSFRRIYEINEQQLGMIEAQRSIGMATVLDVESTRSQLFAQLNQLVSYTQAYIDQSASLAQAMALPEGVLVAPSDPAALRGDWSLPLQETITQARRQREEILASLAAAEAARWTGVAAIRSYLPAFQLVGAASLIANNGNERFTGASIDSNTTIMNRTSYIGLGFTWSIFDGGIQAANALAANAQARQQGAQAASTQLQAMQEVRSSYNQLLTARVALKSAQQSYRSAQIAQEAARARFAVGVGDITSVVQTIQQLSQASQQVSEAILSYNTALAQLYRYTAIWPPHTQSEVQQQLQSLRRSPEEASMPAQP